MIAKYSLKLVILLSFFINSYNAGITYQLSGGRLGDNLLAWMHGQWLSYKLNIPFYYTPFPHADSLVLSENNPHHITSSTNITILNSKSITAINCLSNNIYSIPYFSEEPTEYRTNADWKTFKEFCNIDWNDTTFMSKIRKLIFPKKPLKPHLSQPEKHLHSLAVHIRRGDGYDWKKLNDFESPQPGAAFLKIVAPLKFPPFTFYIEQIKKISEIVNHDQIYVFIFTDVENAVEVVTKITEQLTEYSNIQIDYRKSENGHNKNVLEDFFAMTKFRYIIHPQSNYSLIAAKLTDFEIEVYPSDYAQINGLPHLTKVEYIFKKEGLVHRHAKKICHPIELN